MNDVVIREDNSEAAKALMKKNIAQALIAMGKTAIEITTDYMERKYYRPIHLTGDLIRSITDSVEAGKKQVHIGTNLKYGAHVHNGTRKMRARPFLKDAILDNKQAYREVAAEQLRKGFE